MLSVVILTKNEEADLPACLASVSWSTDVIVFDSFSTDRTIDIAKSAGARVYQRVFDDYATQRNASLAVSFEHPWVLILDADERIGLDLKAELFAFVDSAGPECVAGRIRRRDFLGQTWLRHSQLSPYFVRVVRLGSVHYERAVNEILIADGEIHELDGYFDHHPFSKGIAHWVAKHNVYSSMEARLVVDSRRGLVPFSIGKVFFADDFNERRFHQKELFYRLPCRPVIKFLLIYLLRRGFLDGTAGFTYALLQSFYEYLIVLKTRELLGAGSSLGARSPSQQLVIEPPPER